ncbi:hypothetical protein DL93DRAFT_943829 [Clavulina sp. PMI_390]|nr:hypothetical protein DL93DRAFT_943829 [Clavulina sp. PMI_390]
MAAAALDAQASTASAGGETHATTSQANLNHIVDLDAENALLQAMLKSRRERFRHLGSGSVGMTEKISTASTSSSSSSSSSSSPSTLEFPKGPGTPPEGGGDTGVLTRIQPPLQPTRRMARDDDRFWNIDPASVTAAGHVEMSKEVPYRPVTSDVLALKDWALQAAALLAPARMSKASASTEDSARTPSLSRSPSPEQTTLSGPPTPPAANLSRSTTTIVAAAPLSPPQPTAIPIEHIHLHEGNWMYPPSTVAVPLVPLVRDRTESSSPLASAVGRKFSLRSLRRPGSSKGNKRPSSLILDSASPSEKSSLSRSNPSSTAPQPARSETTPRHMTRQTGPAIIIAPPDCAPAEPYRPSIQRLTSRHVSMNSSLSRHPLAGRFSGTVGEPYEPSIAPSTSSSISSKISPNGFLSRAKRAILFPSGPSPFPNPVLSAPPPTTSESIGSSPTDTESINSESSGNSTSATKNGRRREGGLILPEPLQPEELDSSLLSIAWESEFQRHAREERAERIRKAKALKEAQERRAHDIRMAQYRTPMMGF